MNAGASLSAVPSPIEGSGTAWVLLGSWALSPARPTPIPPRHECRGFSALLVKPISRSMNVRYVRHLTEQQRALLENTMKNDASHRARMRAHGLWLSSEGMTIKAIATIYDVDRDTVSTWMKKWEKHGEKSLHDQPRSGRPTTLNAIEKELAKQYSKEEPRSLKNVVERLAQKTAKRLSISS